MIGLVKELMGDNERHELHRHRRIVVTEIYGRGELNHCVLFTWFIESWKINRENLCFFQERRCFSFCLRNQFQRYYLHWRGKLFDSKRWFMKNVSCCHCLQKILNIQCYNFPGNMKMIISGKEHAQIECRRAQKSPISVAT